MDIPRSHQSRHPPQALPHALCRPQEWRRGGVQPPERVRQAKSPGRAGGPLTVLVIAVQSNAVDGKHRDTVWRVKWAPDDLDNYLNFYSISADGKVINWTIVKSFLWRNEKFLLNFDKPLHNIPPHCTDQLTGKLTRSETSPLLPLQTVGRPWPSSRTTRASTWWAPRNTAIHSFSDRYLKILLMTNFTVECREECRACSGGSCPPVLHRTGERLSLLAMFY